METLLQGLLLGGLYALFALGQSLIFGVMRLTNTAHGDFIILGAFIALSLAALGLSPWIALLITLPITLLTLGLFTLVINALMFWSVSGIVEGFVVQGFWTAFWGALIYSILTGLVSLALGDKD